jgi:hypothetical protein
MTPRIGDRLNTSSQTIHIRSGIRTRDLQNMSSSSFLEHGDFYDRQLKGFGRFKVSFEVSKEQQDPACLKTLFFYGKRIKT